MQTKLRLITRSMPVVAWSLLLMTVLSFLVFQYRIKLQMASYLQVEPLEKSIRDTQYCLSKAFLHLGKYIHGDRDVTREQIISDISLTKDHVEDGIRQARRNFPEQDQRDLPGKKTVYLKLIQLKKRVEFFEDMALQRVENPDELANMLKREHHKLYIEADGILDAVSAQLRLKKEKLDRQRNNLGTGLLFAWVLFALGIGLFTIRFEWPEGEYERRLSRSEARLRSLFAALPDPVLVVDGNGVILDVPSPNSDLLPGPASKLKDQSIELLVGAEKLDEAVAAIREAFSSKRIVPFEYEEEINGRQRVFQGRIIAIPGSRLPSALWVAHDLTGLRQTHEHRLELERRIQQVLRQESLGVMAGGIAHDFDNLLTGVMGHAEMALMEMDEKNPAHDSIKEIHHAACRAAELATQMLKYSGNKHMAFEQVNLNPLLVDMQPELRGRLPEMVELTCVPESADATFEGDGEQIRQVVWNLVLNAIEAIKDQVGGVTVYTGVRHYGEAELKDNYLKESYPAGAYVSLRVADTGGGIDRDDFDRLFDPFFTTKFTGRGLGLAVVQGIVRSHKGVIRVKSAPGQGTSFEILFPVTKPAASGAEPDYSGIL